MSRNQNIQRDQPLSGSLESHTPLKRKRRSPLVSKVKSCIECRRSKLRCSREWPCSNCIRRGMGDSCSGIHTEQSRTSFEGESSTAVPLNQATAIPSPQTNLTESIRPSPQDSVRPFYATTQYFGPTAHSSYLARDLPESSADERIEEAGSSARSREPNHSRRVSVHGFVHTGRISEQESIKALLPTKDSLKKILSTFQEQICWMYSPIFSLNVEDIKFGEDTLPFQENENIALYLAILANVQVAKGASKSVPHPHQFHYQILNTTYEGIWSALNARQWTWCNEITVQQTFFLLCIFLLNYGGGQMSNRFSTIFGICVAKAIESGLNTKPRDSSSRYQKERKRLFWELYSLDAFRSLAYGRPCFFQDNAITLDMPDLVDGEDEFHIIKYANARIINRIMASHLNQSSNDFQKTMEFDSQIRELFSRLPSRLRVQNSYRIGASLRQSPTEILQSCTLALNIHQTLLHLYRPWFVSSTLERIQGRESNYTAQHERSALCLAESSQAMIDLCSRVYSADSQIMMNWAFFLHHAFNAGVCRAIQAIYGQTTDPLHHSAKDDIDEAIELLNMAKKHNRDTVWNEKARLLKKLRQTYERCENSATNPMKKQIPKPSIALRLLGATLHSHDDMTGEGSVRNTFSSDNTNIQALGTNQFECTPTAGLMDNQQSIGMENIIANANDASSWLDLLNNDAFTLTMTDLWNTNNISWTDASSFVQGEGSEMSYY